MFFQEWPRFLERFVTVPRDTYIIGDLNFHLDSKDNADTRKFLDTLAETGLTQHVVNPTHQRGHTLDVVITKDVGSLITDVSVTDPGLCDRDGNLSGDHYAISFTTQLTKPQPT